MSKKGILLVNLGSPKSTKVEDVREYLDEFLMDEKVIDYRWFFRTLLVRGIILNTRPKKSAEAYKTVWTDEGSPLIFITERIKKKLEKMVEVPVEIGMRYAEPSIETGIRKLTDQGVSEIVLFPLYPQYAMSTTETVIDKAA
jgi:ferrochelatase